MSPVHSPHTPEEMFCLHAQAQQQVLLQVTATTQHKRATLPKGGVHILQRNFDREPASSDATWQLVLLLLLL